ncbi:hypothetical protein ES705_11158 [subsurface metagenome]
MSNFKKIFDNGYASKLKVTTPHQTIPSWPCLFSGLSVEQLGYYIFIHPIKGIFNSFEWRDKSFFFTEKLKNFYIKRPWNLSCVENKWKDDNGFFLHQFHTFPKN